MQKGIIAVYVRVSTSHQSVDSQLEELLGHCQRRGWHDAQVFEDCISGATQSRASLDKLMGLVRRGKVHAIVSYKLDRLARSLAHMAQIIAELQTHGVALICPGQGIDTSNNNPAASFQLNILAAVAEFERSLTVERVNAGLAVAKQRGVKLGRPSKNSHLIPRVAELVRQNRCVQVVCRETGLARSSAYELIAEAKAMIAARN